MAPFSNILSCWADQYGSIDTWKIKIRPLLIILWQNILGQQHIALNSLHTTLPNNNFYRPDRGSLISYCSRIRKNVTDRERTENRQTDREFNYRGHSIAVPMEHRVERANTMKIYDQKKCNKQRTDGEQTENRETNYRGFSNCCTDGMPGRAGQ